MSNSTNLITKMAILLIVAGLLLVQACGASFKEHLAHVSPCIESPKQTVVFILKCAEQDTSGLGLEQWKELCSGYLENKKCTTSLN